MLTLAGSCIVVIYEYMARIRRGYRIVLHWDDVIQQYVLRPRSDS